MTCVDISKIAIERIKEEATRRKIRIRAVCADLENYRIEKNYDIIVICGVLQFLKEKGENFIKQVVNKTGKNGINIVDAFRNRWLPKGRLEEIYSDWKLVEKEEYIWHIKDQSIMIYLVAVK